MNRGKCRASKQRISKRNLKIIYIALILTLAYFIVFLVTHPMAPSFYDDDTAYEMLAYDAAYGQFYPTTSYYYTARIMQILPMAVFYEFMGVNFLSSAMWNIVSSLLLVILTFYIGKDLYNEYAGYLAALIMSVFPLVVYLAGTSKETIPMALFSTLALFSAMKGYDENSAKWYFVSGMSIVASFLASLLGSIISIVIFVYILILALYHKISGKGNSVSFKSLYVFGGLAFGLLLVLMYGYFTVSNPFIIFQINIEYSTVPSFTHFSVITPYYAILLPPFFDNLSGINIGYIFYIFYIAVPFLLIKRVKSSYTTIFWSVFTLLYLFIGPMFISISPLKYSVIPRGWQYLPIVAAPVAVTIAIFLVELNKIYKKHKLTVRLITAAILIFIVCSSVNLDFASYYGYRTQMLPIYYLAQYISSLPNTTTVYIPLQLPNLEVYLDFKNINRLIYYNENITNCNITKQYDYIVIADYSNNNQSLCSFWTSVNFFGNKTVTNNYVYLYKP